METTNINPELQYKMDHLISKIGIEKTVKILGKFLRKRSITHPINDDIGLLTSSIIKKASVIFKISKDQLINGTSKESKEARMACYSILSITTSLTHMQIGKIFGNPKRKHVLYYVQKCEDYLSVSAYIKSFKPKYDKLYSDTLEFIEKIK